MNPHVLFGLRLMLGLGWLYNGLWLKILCLDLEHLAIVEGLGVAHWIEPQRLLQLIGGGETLLALGIWSGRYHRFVSAFQGGIMVIMNLTGILFSGAIEAPMQLLIQNLPLFFCIGIVAAYGPGAFVIRPNHPSA